VVNNQNMKPYPAYKPSGIPWLGDIPAHWGVKRLKYLAEINPVKRNMINLTADCPVTFLPMEAVGFGYIETRYTKTLSEVNQGFTHFEEEDVLVAKITPCFENGKGAIATNLENGVGFGTTELHVIRCQEKYNNRYLLYLTISQPFRKIGEGKMQGTAGQKRVMESFVRDFPVPLPPLAEQQAIAAYLDGETARLDALAARYRRLLALLDEKRRALITNAVTRGLNPTAPLKDSGIEWLGDIPAHWEVEKLKQTIMFCQNGIWGDEPDSKNDLPCVRVADFDRTRNRVNSPIPTLRSIPITDASRRMLKNNDLLIEKSGGGDSQPVGTVVLFDLNVPAVCSNFIARIPTAPGYFPNFLCYLHAFLYSIRINTKSIKQNTGIQNLDTESYFSEFVGLPPLAEQQAIAAYLDRETTRLDDLKAKIETLLARLGEYRAALISAAVTGKMDVTQTHQELA